jgi:hypothetical protein
MPQSCPAFWDLTKEFLDERMYVKIRTESEEIRLSPLPRAEELEAGLWITGQDAIKEFCHCMSASTLSRIVRNTQAYSIALEVFQDLGAALLIKTKEVTDEVTLRFREILTPDLIEPIAKLRIRGGYGKSWEPDRETQRKILDRVVNHLIEFGKISKDDIKFYVDGIVGNKEETKRENLKRNLQTQYSDQIPEVGEILRGKKPLLKDKQLDEFSQEVLYGSDKPLDVYVDKYFLRDVQRVKIPNWIIIGLEEHLTTLDEDVELENLVWTLLGSFIEEQGITLDQIKALAKMNLRTEWNVE